MGHRAADILLARIIEKIQYVDRAWNRRRKEAQGLMAGQAVRLSASIDQRGQVFFIYHRLTSFGFLSIFLLAFIGILIAAWISASVDED